MNTPYKHSNSYYINYDADALSTIEYNGRIIDVSQYRRPKYLDYMPEYTPDSDVCDIYNHNMSDLDTNHNQTFALNNNKDINDIIINNNNDSNHKKRILTSFILTPYYPDINNNNNNSSNNNNTPTLSLLHTTDCINTARLLLSSNIDPCIRSTCHYGLTPLHTTNSVDILCLLIDEYHISPYIIDNYGNTPLHTTTSYHIAKLLLDRYHVNPMIGNHKYYTPLHTTYIYNIAVLLFEYNAMIVSSSISSSSLSSLRCQDTYKNGTNKVNDNYYDDEDDNDDKTTISELNLNDGDGYTPLHTTRCASIACLLIDIYPKLVYIPSYNNLLPIHTSHSASITDILIKYGHASPHPYQLPLFWKEDPPTDTNENNTINPNNERCNKGNPLLLKCDISSCDHSTCSTTDHDNMYMTSSSNQINPSHLLDENNHIHINPNIDRYNIYNYISPLITAQTSDIIRVLLHYNAMIPSNFNDIIDIALYNYTNTRIGNNIDHNNNNNNNNNINITPIPHRVEYNDRNNDNDGTINYENRISPHFSYTIDTKNAINNIIDIEKTLYYSYNLSHCNENNINKIKMLLDLKASPSIPSSFLLENHLYTHPSPPRSIYATSDSNNDNNTIIRSTNNNNLSNNIPVYVSSCQYKLLIEPPLFRFKDNIDVIQLLIQYNANIHILDYNGSSILHKHTRPDIIKLLLDSNVYPNVINKKYISPLNNQLCGKSVELLLNAKCSPKEKNPYLQQTSLFKTQDCLAIDLIIKSKVDIRRRDINGRTALFFAPNLSCLQHFVEKYGMDPTHQSSFYETPLFYALDAESVYYLVKAKCNPNHISRHGRYPIHDVGDYYAIEALILCNADVNATTKTHNMTPLLIHSQNNDICMLLLKHGADPNIPSKYGHYFINNSISPILYDQIIHNNKANTSILQDEKNILCYTKGSPYSIDQLFDKYKCSTYYTNSNSPLFSTESEDILCRLLSYNIDPNSLNDLLESFLHLLNPCHSTYANNNIKNRSKQNKSTTFGIRSTGQLLTILFTLPSVHPIGLFSDITPFETYIKRCLYNQSKSCHHDYQVYHFQHKSGYLHYHHSNLDSSSSRFITLYNNPCISPYRIDYCNIPSHSYPYHPKSNDDDYYNIPRNIIYILDEYIWPTRYELYPYIQCGTDLSLLSSDIINELSLYRYNNVTTLFLDHGMVFK